MKRKYLLLTILAISCIFTGCNTEKNTESVTEEAIESTVVLEEAIVILDEDGKAVEYGAEESSEIVDSENSQN